MLDIEKTLRLYQREGNYTDILLIGMLLVEKIIANYDYTEYLEKNDIRERIEKHVKEILDAIYPE